MSYLEITVPTTCQGVSATFCTISPGTPTASAFTLTATPTSLQKDTLCGTLSINQQGVRTATGTAAQHSGPVLVTQAQH